MDHEEMRAAYERAMTYGTHTVTTTINGSHIPTYVVQQPTKSVSVENNVGDLVQRLLEQHEVRYDPLCREAAQAIEYIQERNRANLNKVERSHYVMSALFQSLNEIVHSGKDWPWEYAGAQGMKQIEDALQGFNDYIAHEYHA